MELIFKSDALEFNHEDNGCAWIGEVCGVTDKYTFVRIQGWDEDREGDEQHASLRLLQGKKVEVIVRVVE